MRILLFSANPSDVHASMPVAGGAVLRRTSSSLKSVCVSSLDFGPRSRDFGGAETYAEVGDVCKHLYRDCGNRFVGS
jgi:hypothetical protein